MSPIPLSVNVDFFDRFLQTDIAVFEWVQRLQQTALAPVLTFFLKILTTLGEGGVFFIAVALFLLFTQKNKKTGCAMLCALLIMLLVNNIVLKSIFDRPRPFNLFEDSRLGLVREQYAWWAQRYVFPNIVSPPKSLSFPSGHSSSAFAAAFACVFCSKRAKIFVPVLLTAVLMAFSRIYAEVHYFSDVAAGALVGFACGLFGVYMIRIVWNRWGKIAEDFLETFSEKLRKNICKKKSN